MVSTAISLRAEVTQEVTQEPGRLAPRRGSASTLGARRPGSDQGVPGTGALAAATTADHPGLPEAVRHVEVRELRAPLIEIGEQNAESANADPALADAAPPVSRGRGYTRRELFSRWIRHP